MAVPPESDAKYIALLTILLLVSFDTFRFCATVSVAATIWFIVSRSTFINELALLFTPLRMEQQATNLLAVLKNTSVPIDTKLDHLTKLKTHIKQHQVPEAAIGPAFEVVRFSISNAQFQEAGFSTLSHLAKRLELQDQLAATAGQGKKTYPLILERLGDLKDRVRLRAIQAFTEFWKASHADVEQIIRDSALAGKNSRAKETAMQWIIKMNKEYGLQFKSFMSKIVECLEDADGGVRDTAKATIVELFKPLPEAAKTDLKKQLQQGNVRKTIVLHIYQQLGLSTSEVDLVSSTLTHDSEALSNDKQIGGNLSSDPSLHNHALSMSEIEAERLDPIYVNSHREIEEIFRDMHPFFEGKESEHNWSPREKSIIKLRRITKGNAPADYTITYLVSVKGLLDGILKTVNSLRTTVCTNGCHLLQDIARVAGTGLDPMVEILLQNLIKLCGGTKTIAAQNGNTTVNAILAHVSYNVRLMQHVWLACQDKNVRPRSFATEWLRTIIIKHGHHKSILEHANGLELIDKCIKRGLTDANPTVRECMRPTYWAFWRFWPDRAESILNMLEPKHQGLLLKDSSNPDPNKISSDSTAIAGPITSAPKLPKIVTASAVKVSLKEAIAEQKRQARLAARPGSAQGSTSPTKPTFQRPATSMAGSLSSAPLRPGKAKAPAKKVNSPAISPVKSKPKAPVPTSSDDQGLFEQSKVSPIKSNFSHLEPSIKKSNIGKPMIAHEESIILPRRTPTPPSSGNANAPVELPHTNPSSKVLKVSEDTLTRAQRLVSSMRSCSTKKSENNPQDSKSSPSKAAEDLTFVIPSGTAVDSPGPMSPQILGPNGYESSRSILGELPLNHEGGPRPFRGVRHVSRTSNTSTDSTKSNLIAAEQRMIDSGIVRIRNRTLDAFGYRRLQQYIQTRPDLWQDHRYEELFDALLQNIDTRDEDPVRTHVLKTIQVMMSSHPDLAKPLMSRGLRILMHTRSYYRPYTIVTAELEATSKKMVYLLDDIVPFMSVIMDLLENTQASRPLTVAMALETLAELMHRATYRLPDSKIVLKHDAQFRLGSCLLKLLASDDVALRKGSMECLLELYDMAGDGENFWVVMSAAPDEDKNLLAYFLAMRDGEDNGFFDMVAGTSSSRKVSSRKVS